MPYTEIDIKIPNAYVSSQKTAVDACEFVPDAYEAILEAEREDLITILRYDEFIANEKRREWLRKITVEEYEDNAAHPEYRFFLEARFGDMLGENYFKETLAAKNVRSRKNRTEPGKTGTCKKDLATENSDKKQM